LQSSGFFAFDEDHGMVRFDVPPESKDLLGPNNSRTQYDFRFDGLFGMKVTQETVFETLARPAVENALAGYNATIFAYGQTGSGKTFTITGGPQRYEDRGVIPRALQTIFKRLEEQRKGGAQSSVYISYLEIYNEQGYDLLDDGSAAAAGGGMTRELEELPRVTLREDEYGNVHLGNLSVHRADSEEAALNLLFQGDTNRAVCETAMNPVSSRSHCVFTIMIEQREEGSPVIRRSKLNLVDLAGSERAHKTGAQGTLFREAVHINTSLLALRRVIDALHERLSKRGGARERVHVPYRDSTITSVLRDSLGGNCKTAVVATISAEAQHTDESISTCRFAQGVARVKNDASVNLETDPSVLVARLKEQIASLQAEKRVLAEGAGEAGRDLTDDERGEVCRACEQWVRGGSDDAFPPEDALMPSIGGYSLPRLQEAFRFLRQLIRTCPPAGASSESAPVAAGGETEAVAKLKTQLAQRDREIAILVNMARELRTQAQSKDAGRDLPMAASSSTAAPPPRGAVLPNGDVIPWKELEDKENALALFKEVYPRREQLAQAKDALREKYSEAKRLAAEVNESRAKIVEVKASVEEIRVKQAVGSLTEDDSEVAGAPASEAERALLRALDAEQQRYNAAFARLKSLKGEIEYTQRLLEAGRIRLQSDFESWYARSLLDMKTQGGASSAQPVAAAVMPESSGKADSDIQRFYAARDQLLKMTGKA
jgi:kinesin family member 6/9